MTEAKWSLRDLQEQQREWIRANLSDPATGAERPSWMPLLGLAEELGELAEAKSDSELDDAMADIIIFGADYCSAVGWDIQELWDNRKRLSEYSGWSGTGPRLVVCVGRIAHHHLKRSQGIRGSAEHHDREGQRWFAALLEDVGFTIGGALRDERAEQAVFDLVRRTWEQVRQRNWRTKGVM